MPPTSANIKLQGFEPRTDNFFWIRQFGETDKNGCFDIPAIPAGTYHAFATLHGYVSPASLLPIKSLFGLPAHFGVPDTVLDANLPKVTISAQAPTVLDFRLEVGGSISGTVSWQDGAPAKNNATKLMLIDGEEKRRDYRFSSTDTEGDFRLECLPTGRYIIGARVPRFLDYVCKNAYPGRLPAMVNCASSYYWTGGTPYYMEAVPLELQSREDIAGISIVLPMLEREL